MSVFDDPALLSEQLKKIFGYDKFYSTEQEDATKAVSKGDKDVFINLQPGAGKSLCFQLPTVLKPKTVTVVFVPTNVLAKDQMDFLKRNKIDAEYLHKGMSKKQLKSVLDNLEADERNCQFLYAALDKSTRDVVQKVITKLNNVNAMNCIVFDEAHCISNLSHDYIPDYEDVAELMKNKFEHIPKIALTGTATKEVRRHVIQQLHMKKPLHFFTISYYPIVCHDVRFMDTLPQPFAHLKSFIEDVFSSLHKLPSKNRDKSGIIFCRTKETTKIITKRLRAMSVPVYAYHGDMTRKERTSIHERWTAGKIRIIAATRPFGIGLHRRDVNFVVHWGIPMSIQQLVQEVGRINQDGRPAYCRVYFSYEEEINTVAYIKSALGTSHYNIDLVTRQLRFFQQMIDYCLQTKCRHVAHWNYFEQDADKCNVSCDACLNTNTQRQRVKDFLKYRESIKKTAIKISERKGWAPYCPSIRKWSYRMLLKELETNCCVAEEHLGYSIKKEDLSELARQLEYSLCIGAKPEPKYFHNCVSTIMNIHKCSESKLPCGYLRLCQTQPIKNVNMQFDKVMAMDDNVVVAVEAPSVIEAMEIVNDSESVTD